MLKEELVSVAQQKAKEYSKSVQRQRRIHRLKKVAIGISMATFFIAAIGITGKADLETIQAKEMKTESEQKYIVRYGFMESKDTIVTEDGNLWELIDGPEYENGTEVRVLFDSMGTKEVEDDVIIDITERR